MRPKWGRSRVRIRLRSTPAAQGCFDFHHSALDVLAGVHPQELELDPVVMAIVDYGLAQEGI